MFRFVGMPLLGFGTQLVDKDLPMPNAPYHELATWATINFAYTYKNERDTAELASLACEPEKVARSIKIMNIKHAVITSVDRDDLKDGGSIIWTETIKAIRRMNPTTTLETLIPDFKGEKENIQNGIILPDGSVKNPPKGN